jgi:thiol-disulfide isomerase/thioredoxin
MIQVEFFTASWCGACKGLKPHVIAECKAQNVELITIDTDSDTGMKYASGLEVSALPTVIIWDDEMELDRMIGNIGRYDFAKRLSMAGKME